MVEDGMTYVDVTLTPEASYSYVNNRQVYDAVATAMTTHPAWDYIGYADSTSGANTYRRHVWRCTAAQSGLTNSYYVVFEVQFVTATGLYSTAWKIPVYMAEGYSGTTLSKMASYLSAVTLASDRTNPATWDLTVNAVPANILSNIFAPGANTSSVRFICIVAKDCMMLTWHNGTQAAPLYIGAYDSFLNTTDDPMPLVSIGNTFVGGCTRAPLMPTGISLTNVFGATCYVFPHSATTSFGDRPNAGLMGSLSNLATLGGPTDTTWALNMGGPVGSQVLCCTYTNSQPNNSTRALVRGTYKLVRAFGTIASHSYGDTFMVDGKVHVGTGVTNNGVWNTEAV
jgi:hypothetical protein